MNDELKQYVRSVLVKNIVPHPLYDEVEQTLEQYYGKYFKNRYDYSLKIIDVVPTYTNKQSAINIPNYGTLLLPGLVIVKGSEHIPHMVPALYANDEDYFFKLYPLKIRKYAIKILPEQLEYIMTITDKYYEFFTSARHIGRKIPYDYKETTIK